jgi:16S rRNA (guanine527-N7)-methyltransferase
LLATRRLMSDVPRETSRLLAELQKLVLEEATRQNLISAATIGDFERRHIDDSLQLIPHLSPDGAILDIGAGAGFPGLVIACAIDRPMHLVEPRAKRAAFLEKAATSLGLPHVHVHQCKVERVEVPAIGSITARAVASLSTLFTIAEHLADKSTRWVLPKGRTARSELADAQRTWQGVFHVEQSMTDPEAAIIIAERVRRRMGR